MVRLAAWVVAAGSALLVLAGLLHAAGGASDCTAQHDGDLVDGSCVEVDALLTFGGALGLVTPRLRAVPSEELP